MFLNDVRAKFVKSEHILKALESASSEFEEGTVGAGTGMLCYSLKGGIGSASRIMGMEHGKYTMGVLVLSNFGILSDLRINGKAVGQELKEAILQSYKEQDKGSIMIIVSTDLPVSERHKEFEDEDQLEIIPFDGDVLEHVVEMDMYLKKPFIKIHEIMNKKGEKVLSTKKELRDAIIWFSYQGFIDKKELKECYFISNNTKEFGDTGSNKSPENEPYALHPSLIEGNNLIPYRTVTGFLSHNDTKVKELFKDIHTQILSDELIGKIKDELEAGLLRELIDSFFGEQIISATIDIFSRKQPDDIHRDYFMEGYIEPALEGSLPTIISNVPASV